MAFQRSFVLVVTGFVLLVATPPASAQQRLPTGPRGAPQGFESAAPQRPAQFLRIRLGPGGPRVSAPTRAWMTDPATGARLAIITLYPNGTADIPVLASVKEGGDDSGGGCEGEDFEYEPLPPLENPFPADMAIEDRPLIYVPKPTNICGSAFAVVEVRPVRLVARQVEPAPQPCPSGQRPPCAPVRNPGAPINKAGPLSGRPIPPPDAPVQNPGAPIGTGPVPATGSQHVKGIDIIVKKPQPQQSVGINGLGVGLGKVPGGMMLYVSQATDGTVTGRLERPAPAGSRIAMRDASNRIVARAPVRTDGTFRLPRGRTPLQQMATACLETRGAAPVCSEPGALSKAVTKAGTSAGAASNGKPSTKEPTGSGSSVAQG